MQKISIAIFAIAFLSVNCSFLRNLNVEITANTGKFSPATTSCFNKDVNYTIDITNAAAVSALEAKLNGDAAELTCQPIKAGDTKISCVGPTTGFHTEGTYTVATLKKAASGTGADLGTMSDNKQLLIKPAPGLGSVTASQTVDASKNEAFKILFADGATFCPLVYVKVGTSSTTKVLPAGTCTFTASSHEATCTLKAGNGIVKDGDEFKVFYDKDCTVTDAGITVRYSSANFAKIGALIFAIALLF